MENIKREIRLFFVTYGKLFAFIIGIVIAVIFIVQSLNTYVKEQNEKIYSSVEYKESVKRKEQQIQDRQYISKFIDWLEDLDVDEVPKLLQEE
jgi:hypothetical protein